MKSMIIDHKSGQTSGTKLLRSSQSCAVLIWDPHKGLSLLSVGLSKQLPAQQLLLGWEKSQLSQSGIPNGTHGICPSPLDQGFLPCPHSTPKKVLQSLLHSQGSKGSPACCWKPKMLRFAHTIRHAL